MLDLAHTLLATNDLTVGGFKWSGNFTSIDLVAASTNALNGALLARRPDHYKQYTVVGILLMAILGGIGGGVTRDVLVAQVPSALTNPAYILLCIGFGVIGYFIAYAGGQLFREGVFSFLTAFSLPWYAIVGAQKGVEVGLPIVGCLLLAVVGPTAGRYYIDLTSGKAAKQFIRSEWFVGTAVLTGAVWIAVYWTGANTWLSAGVAFLVGFTFRIAAMWFGWEEPMPAEPRGVVVHADHIALGRKLTGKSTRELAELGLIPESEHS
jgi:uncharacterized membrane protein YeiH